MSRKKTTKTEKINNNVGQLSEEPISLNNNIYTEFSIEQLEQRLETSVWGCSSDSIICTAFTQS